MDIAEIGRSQLFDALTGGMEFCEVSEWLDDDGKPVNVYWNPLTGIEQKKIELASNQVDKILLTVKVRARDEDRNLIFDKMPLETLLRDYDFQVMRAIPYIMVSDTGYSQEDEISDLSKE